jgi:hypothetical protein
MFGAHETQIHLAHWQRSLPFQVDIPGREFPVTRDDLIAVIRWELLPFITYGPSYQRAVTDNLRTALHMFRQDRGEEFAYWIGATVDAAARARKPEPFDPAAPTVLASHWFVSYEITQGKEGAVLRAHHADVKCSLLRHPVHYGKAFPDQEAAREYAWRFGLVKRFVSRFAAVPQA